MIYIMKRLLLATVFAVVGLALVAPPVSAQPTKKKCIIVNGRKVFIYENTTTSTNSTGSGTFQAQTSIPQTGPVNVNLLPVSINVTVGNAATGTITTTLDPTRIPGPTILRSNSQTSRYPLTATLRFFGIAEISSQPCKKFRSLSELVFENTSITSILPFLATQSLTLTTDVDFEDVDAPGTVGLTLKAGSTFVNLN